MAETAGRAARVGGDWLQVPRIKKQRKIISGVVFAFSCLFILMVSWDDATHAQGGSSILSKSLLRKSSQTPRFVFQVSLCPFKLAVKINHHKASVQSVAEESRKTCPLCGWHQSLTQNPGLN